MASGLTDTDGHVDCKLKQCQDFVVVDLFWGEPPSE